MKIAFNPSTVAALITPPNNKDITFDLRGQNIFARGVKFCGTDTNTWRDIKINNVSIGSHTLDLRNGSNTTLTNTNGVVTINSTWRPVVDNLTSDSTTSSLSANQGRILKALIDSKLDSDHNHDDRYLKLTGGTMFLGEGLKFHADNNYFGTDADARIISLLDGNDKICDGGLIIDERATLDGKEYVAELLRIRDSEFKWRGSDILHSGNSYINGSTITINGSSLNVIDQKVTQISVSSGYTNFRPVLITAGTNSSYAAGYTPGTVTDQTFITNALQLSPQAGNLYLKGSAAIGTTNFNRKLNVNGDIGLLNAGSVRDLSIGGGIYWNPYVESTTDSSDAASITVVRQGVAGGTTLVLSQMNDANDTIQFKTNAAARLYHNSYPILTIQNTYVSNHKGYINGTEITQVNNASSSDRTRALKYSGTGNSEITAYQTDSSFMGRSGWASYIICNHGDGSKYYSQTIAMPFNGSPIYRRLENGVDKGWKKFYTEENPPSWNNIINKPSSFTPSSHTHTWTSIIDKVIATNEFNIVNSGFNSELWFNYLPINDRSKSATISKYCFGNGNKGLTTVRASGFIKNGSSSSYVLLGDGGHTLLSSLNGSHNHDDRYVRAFGTSNDNINSDWGQSFKTFDPIPSGTPPEQNPNISILNIGENFNRRKQLAFIYGNDNIYYRRHIESGFTSWKRLALTSDIPIITNYYWANVKISTSSNTQTQPSVYTIYANHWFRSRGTSGWYSESYGGGIWMKDSNWIRTYGGKSFYCDHQIYSSNSIKMGNILLEHTDEINNSANGGIHLNNRNSGNVSLCVGGGKVGIGTRDPSQELYVLGYTHTKGFGIGIQYLSELGLLRTINPYDGYTYSCLEIGRSTKVSCIIADKVLLSGVRGILLKFVQGFDGQIVLLKDLENYGSGNGRFWVMPSGCEIINADTSNILISQNQISNTYDDGRSRFFIYSSKYRAWIEFICSNI